MKLSALFCAAALIACIAAPCAAAPVQGTLTGKDSFNGYMGVMTNIQTLSGSDTVADTAFVFCIDASAHWAGDGATHQYTLGDSFAPFLGHAGGADKATGLLHYVLDNYYAPLLAGAFGRYSGYGFNEAIWELTTDFDGTLDSLSTSTGGVYNTDSDDAASRALYTSIVDDLRDNFAAIAPGYRSNKYDVRYLTESDPHYQSLAMVTEKSANEVPEPSTLALMLVGGLGLAARAARRKKTA